jgi:hypothetical protein
MPDAVRQQEVRIREAGGSFAATTGEQLCALVQEHGYRPTADHFGVTVRQLNLRIIGLGLKLPKAKRHYGKASRLAVGKKLKGPIDRTKARTLKLRSLSRERLYRDVWEYPATLLAKKYGVSLPTFLKRCDLLDVPRPPVGYWSMLSAGRAPAATPLPPPGKAAQEVMLADSFLFVGRTRGLSGMERLQSFDKLQLTRLLWSEPQGHIRARLVVSRPALDARCQELNVRRPPRGWWSLPARHRIFPEGIVPFSPVQMAELLGERATEIIPGIVAEPAPKGLPNDVRKAIRDWKSTLPRNTRTAYGYQVDRFLYSLRASVGPIRRRRLFEITGAEITVARAHARLSYADNSVCQFATAFRRFTRWLKENDICKASVSSASGANRFSDPRQISSEL